jgi:uncharacterized LabA/DUF88 family protein
MLTNVYIDAFNLYYGCLKGSPYKWLDLGAFVERLLPSHDIQRIRYFTAKINTRPADLQAPVRQETYLRALETVPGLTIHLGHYLTNPTRLPFANPWPGGPKTAHVIKSEEKGSDVNMATLLLTDAFRGDAEVFVVISNDSDFIAPIRVVHDELSLPVGLINPHPVERRSRALLSCNPTFFKQVRKGALASSQFPAQIQTATGLITRPATW